MAEHDRIEILSAQELGRTLARLASQVLETVSDSHALMLLGIPTRGVHLSGQGKRSPGRWWAHLGFFERAQVHSRDHWASQLQP